MRPPPTGASARRAAFNDIFRCVLMLYNESTISEDYEPITFRRYDGRYSIDGWLCPTKNIERT